MRLNRLGVLALALGLAVPAFLQAANYPFPPTASWTYPYGIKPTTSVGASFSADWSTLAGKWSTYKSNYLSPNGGSPARIVCSAQQSGDTVSEGIGYGMILAVYFNDQATFNALWAYEQQHLDSLGLMNWDISSSGGVIGANSASDGDEDMAYALWLAHYQWGDGTTNYTSEATTQTQLVEENDLDGNLRVKPGDSFDSCAYPSYFMPSEYVVFGKRTSNTGTWNTVGTNSYQTINDACNTSSGLIAEQTGDTGTGGGCTVSSTEYQYNSCRVPFYMTLDYVYNGNSSANTEMGRLQSFFSGIGAGSVDDCYNVNVGGTSSSCSSNTNHDAFVGPAGCSLMRSATSQSQLNSYYQALMAQGTTSYFDDSWQLLSLLLMQGNMPDIADPASIYSPTPTPTATNYAGTPTLTATQTPVANGVVFEDFEWGQVSDGYTFAFTGSTASQSVVSTQKNTGIYSNAVTLDVVKGASYQYGGAGFNSNYADSEGVINASGTISLQFSVLNTGPAFAMFIDFKEGGTPTAAVEGGHGYQWDSPQQTILSQAGWQHFSIPISSFTWDTSNNKNAAGTVITTPPAGDTGLTLSSVQTCQLQTNAVWGPGTFYVDDIDFMPTTAFTPTATPTPLNNPYTQIWDDFESPLSLSKTAYCSVAVTGTGVSASWALNTTAGDFVDGARGGALTYNTGTTVPTGAYVCEGTDISPYSNSQFWCNDSGAAFIAYWIKAPAGFRYQVEFQEAGVLTATVQGADGAAWYSDMQTANSTGAWQYVELPIANFNEDPYDPLCNPTSESPSPCLSENAGGPDTEQMGAISSFSFKLAAGQSSGVLYFDDLAFITTWKTPTSTPTPMSSATFTRSPSPSVTPSVTWSDSPTATPTASPTATGTPTASDTPSRSDTPTDSPSVTSTMTGTATDSPTGTPSLTPSPSFTKVPIGSTDTDTATISPTFSATPSPTGTPSGTPSVTDTPSATDTSTASPSVTSTWTFTLGPSPTATATPSLSPNDTSTDTPSASPTATGTSTASDTPSVSDTPTASPTMTFTFTSTPSATETATPPLPGSTPTSTPVAPAGLSTPTTNPSVAADSGGYAIIVSGTSSTIESGAEILFNGQPLTTTITVEGGGITVLTATGPADLGASQATIVVANPVPGTAGSNPFQAGAETTAGVITLKQATATASPTPTGSTATPTPVAPAGLSTPTTSPSVAEDSGGYAIIVSGTSGTIQSGAEILFNGQPLATSITVEAGGITVLTATAPSDLGAAQATIVVANPVPGTAGSNPFQAGAETTAGVITLKQTTATVGPAVTTLIVANLADPDPNPHNIAVELSLPVDSLTLKVYSSAFALVGSTTSGALPAGWNHVSLPTALGASSNGLYYYLLSASRNGTTLKGKAGKLYILR